MQTNNDLIIRLKEDLKLRNRSEKTTEAYVRDVSNLFKFFPDKSATEISAEEVRKYMLALIETGINPKTVNTYMASVKFFYKVTLGTPLDSVYIPRMKEEEYIPDILTHDEMNTLLNVCPLKYQAIILLSYGCGLRVGEIARLRTTDIEETIYEDDNGNEVQGYKLKIRKSKYRKGRTVPIDEDIVEFLRDYWRVYKPKNVDNYMFIGTYRTKMNPDSITDYIKKAAKRKTNIRKKINTHLFRHGFATNQYERGVDLFTISRLLGHSNIQTSTIYTKLARVKKAKNITGELDVIQKKRRSSSSNKK